MHITAERQKTITEGFASCFGSAPNRFFSAPGRTEIGGNHTDHQRGKVLAAAVNLDSVAGVALNGSDSIRIQSQGYPMVEVRINELAPVDGEKNSTASLVRGVAASFAHLGCKLCGFDAYVVSDVLPGSGLSSSAAFEVLVGTIMNALYDQSAVPMPEIAHIGQLAENNYFGKPSGLMDQMASAVGGFVNIDFADPGAPKIHPVAFDFSSCGYSLCIIDSGASHADLTDEYAAVPDDMKAVAHYFGKEVLSEVDETAFYAAIPALRKRFDDRAVLRSIHYYAENKRVDSQVAALERGDFECFLRLVRESGYSSYMYLQNVIPLGSKAHQDVAFALAMAERALGGRGACRVHGGGFAGTIQAFVPNDMLDIFVNELDGVLGKGACHVLSIRNIGGTELNTTGI